MGPFPETRLYLNRRIHKALERVQDHEVGGVFHQSYGQEVRRLEEIVDHRRGGSSISDIKRRSNDEEEVAALTGHAGNSESGDEGHHTLHQTEARATNVNVIAANHSLANDNEASYLDHAVEPNWSHHLQRKPLDDRRRRRHPTSDTAEGRTPARTHTSSSESRLQGVLGLAGLARDYVVGFGQKAVDVRPTNADSGSYTSRFQDQRGRQGGRRHRRRRESGVAGGSSGQFFQDEDHKAIQRLEQQQDAELHPSNTTPIAGAILTPRPRSPRPQNQNEEGDKTRRESHPATNIANIITHAAEDDKAFMSGALSAPPATAYAEPGKIEHPRHTADSGAPAALLPAMITEQETLEQPEQQPVYQVPTHEAVARWGDPIAARKEREARRAGG